LAYTAWAIASAPIDAQKNPIGPRPVELFISDQMLNALLSLSAGVVHDAPPFLWPATPWHLTHFRKPNCSFCDEIEPEFLRVSTVYSSTADISFYQIDCRSYARFCHSHSAFGVPSIVLCDKKCGVRERFAGKRSAEHIIAFVASHTSLPPSDGFSRLRDATLEEVFRAVAALMCVAVPVFFGPIPTEVRQAFDGFAGDPEFAAFALNDRHLFWLVPQFAQGLRPAVLFLTLFHTAAFYLNETEGVLADTIMNCRGGGARAGLREFVVSILNGHKDRPLQTVFGNFLATGDCTEFAQLMMAATDDEITRQIDKFRGMILSSGMGNQTQRQLSKRILILKGLRQIRREPFGPDDGL
jgi:hypothetical protein